MGKGSIAIVTMLHSLLCASWTRRGNSVPARQHLWWTEQERHHGPLPVVESHDQTTLRDHAILYDPRAHKVQSRLVLFASEEVPTDEVGDLSNLCGVVNNSAAVKIAHPTGLEDGSCQVYFSQFYTKVKLHYLRFASLHMASSS